jgi:hypothetical protein
MGLCTGSESSKLLINDTRRSRTGTIGAAPSGVRLLLQIGKKEKRRTAMYADLLKVAKKTIGYAKQAVEVLQANPLASASLSHYIKLAEKVVAQTFRRVIRGEKVPSCKKTVSIFEPHTDIIVKGGREPLFAA